MLFGPKRFCTWENRMSGVPMAAWLLLCARDGADTTRQLTF